MSYDKLGEYLYTESLLGWVKEVYKQGYIKWYIDPFTGKPSDYEIVLTTG